MFEIVCDIPLARSRHNTCSSSCAFGDILNGYAFAGVSGVVVTVVRDLNHTYKFVMDHDALGAVLAGAFRFVHINVVDQFPK